MNPAGGLSREDAVGSTAGVRVVSNRENRSGDYRGNLDARRRTAF
jgi:hypothetical protein